MKKFLQVLMLAIIFFGSAQAQSESFGGRGMIQSRRMASGGSGSKYFCYPVGPCTDAFNYKMDLGFLKKNPAKNGLHLGEDWNGKGGNSTDLGDPVYAAGAGIVTFAEDVGSGWGKCVIVMHELADGTKVNSLYAHMNSILVDKGDSVALHQQVGTIGTANGLYEHSAHLHFEIRKNENNLYKAGYGYSLSQAVFDQYLDPSSFIKSRLPPLYSLRPMQLCTGQLKKTGEEYACTATAQGGAIGKGETLLPLVTIDNMWVDHKFAVTTYHNKVEQSVEVSTLQQVDSEYGWSTSQMVKQVKDAAPGEWRFVFELRHNFNGANFEKKLLHEIVYIVSDVAQSTEVGTSKPWFLLKSTEVCKKFGGGEQTDWVYTCISPTDVYDEGDTFYVLIGIMKVLYDHRFVVNVTRDGLNQYKYISDWNDVPDGKGWESAYTWPKIEEAKAGTWKFAVYLEFKDKTLSPVVTKTVVVKKKVTSVEPTPTEPKSTKAQDATPDATPMSVAAYTYVQTDVCTSIGGPDAEWNYWCNGKKTTFSAETKKVYILTKLIDVWVDHRYKTVVYKDDVLQWQWFSPWSSVDSSYGWKYSYFFPAISNLTPGKWKVVVSVATMATLKEVETKSFTVLGSSNTPSSESGSSQPSTPAPADKPTYQEAPKNQTPAPTQSVEAYVFKGVKACKSISGGANTNWTYTCNSPQSTFKVGENITLLAHFASLTKDHRFKIVTRKNNTSKWSYISPWNYLGSSSWDTSYFFPKHDSLTFGNWEYEIFIETTGASGFIFVGSVKIFVSY